MESILVTIGHFAEGGKRILAQVGEVQEGVKDRKDLLARVRDVTILVVGLEQRIDREVIDAGTKLKVIATATTGLDHIDIAYAESKGITVLSLKGETAFLQSVTSTAELALGLLLALIRRIPAAHLSVRDGTWDRSSFEGHSLKGKTLGIVGYGRLGKMMGRYGTALEMTVLFTDPAEEGSTPLAKLLETSDAISLHVPLNEDTEEMIGAKELKMIKPGTVLINTSRGKIVDEREVLASLENGQLAGYATDVLADELSFTNKNASSPLIDYAKTHDNIILTPHIGGMTVESREATDIFIAQKIRKAVK